MTFARISPYSARVTIAVLAIVALAFVRALAEFEYVEIVVAHLDRRMAAAAIAEVPNFH